VEEAVRWLMKRVGYRRKMSSGIWLNPPPLENAHYVDAAKTPETQTVLYKVAKETLVPGGKSIPPQRVLSHDRRADLLSPCAATPPAAS